MRNPADLERLLQKMGLDLVAVAGDITDITGTLQDNQQLEPYQGMSIFTCVTILSHCMGLISGNKHAGAITPEQIRDIVRILLTIADNLDNILAICGSKYERGAVMADLRCNLFSSGGDDGSARAVKQLRINVWKEMAADDDGHAPVIDGYSEEDSPIHRTPTPCHLQSMDVMLNTLTEYGTLAMPRLPQLNAHMRSALKTAINPGILKQVKNILILPPSMCKETVIDVLILLLGLTHHCRTCDNQDPDPDSGDTIFHPVPLLLSLQQLLTLAIKDRSAMFILHCMLAQVCSVMGFVQEPVENTECDTPLPSCGETGATIVDYMCGLYDLFNAPASAE
jgi:hypothetical protein